MTNLNNVTIAVFNRFKSVETLQNKAKLSQAEQILDSLKSCECYAALGHSLKDYIRLTADLPLEAQLTKKELEAILTTKLPNKTVEINGTESKRTIEIEKCVWAVFNETAKKAA